MNDFAFKDFKRSKIPIAINGLTNDMHPISKFGIESGKITQFDDSTIVYY